MTLLRGFLFMLLIGIALSLCIFRFCIITTDISLEPHLWFKVGSKEQYKKYSYLLAKVDDERLKDTLIVKQVVCSEGDELTIVDQEVYCNGNEYHIGKILDKDKYGKPLHSFMSEDKMTIPNGMYFIAGTNRRSYDSRYFGLVTQKNIIIEVFPIL